MEHYDLDETEVVLYKGNVTLPNLKGDTQLILTNINLVLITRVKKLLAKEQVSVESYPMNEIKYYRDIPQVLRKGNLLELYFLHEEVEFSFNSSSDARKFVNATLTLLTNKTNFERKAEKVKSTISTLDNSLGINSKNITTNLLANNVVGKTMGSIGKGIKTVGKIFKKK